MIEQGKRNLTHPIGLYAEWAAQSARAIDPLYSDSLMTLARDLTPAEHDALIAAKDGALESLHAFADWLEARKGSMTEWRPMGEENYSYMLHHILLLPLSTRDVSHPVVVEL